MPLIPRPKYRTRDWLIDLRTRERDEAVAMTKEARTWAIRMKRERDEAEMLLDEVYEALRIRYELCAKAESERDEEIKRRDLWIEIARKNFRIASKIGRERDDVISERDNLQQQRDYYQGLNDELVFAMRVADNQLWNTYANWRERCILAMGIIKAALAKADEL